MISTNYSCAQNDLYVACRNAWHTCQANQPAFVGFKSKYTEAFIAQCFDDIDAADVLLDADARYGDVDKLKLSLSATKDKVIEAFSHLTAYIDEVWTGELRKIEYKSAGQNYLSKAKGNNWSAMNGLLSSAGVFITQNTAELLAKGYMPTDFPARFESARLEFETTLRLINAAEDLASKMTEAKVVANNAIYTTMSAMCADAQRLFINQPDLAKQFLVTGIIDDAKARKAAGIGGKVVIKGTKKGIKNAVVSIAGTDKSATTDKDGRYDFGALPPDKYKLSVIADGYQLSPITEVVVKSTVVSRFNVELSPVVETQRTVIMPLVKA
jgi:Carboxypeptidase regulatory-like domain